MTSDHDRMEELVAAFVLGACDDEEAALVRAHIGGCASCRALARRLSQAAGALPLAVPEVRPPDRLRANILAAAAANPPRAEEPPSSARILPLPGTAGRGASAGPGVRGRAEERRRRRRFSPQWAGAAAVAVLLLVMAGWIFSLMRQISEPPAQYALVGTGTMASTTGTVTRYANDSAVVALSGMPPAAPGKVYELWLIDESGRTVPGGIFNPTAEGTASLGVKRPLSGIRTVAVTQEDGPTGTSAPTSKPELAGQVG